jgi:hypothetical protein
MELSEIPASLWDLANRINWASGAFRRAQLHGVARRLVALKAVKSCYMRMVAISSVPQVGVPILTGHPLGHEKEDSGCRLVPTPKCSRALASTLPAAPASFAQVYPQVVWRERVPVTTVIWNLGGAAAVSAREPNHGRAIIRNPAPATTLSGTPTPSSSARCVSRRSASRRTSRLSLTPWRTRCLHPTSNRPAPHCGGYLVARGASDQLPVESARAHVDACVRKPGGRVPLYSHEEIAVLVGRLRRVDEEPAPLCAHAADELGVVRLRDARGIEAYRVGLIEVVVHS